MKPHRYLEGASLTAFGLGNRLIIRTIKPHVTVTKQQIGGALALAAFFSPVLARPVARYAPTSITVVLVLWVVVAVAVGNTEAAANLAKADQEAREKAAKEKAAEGAASKPADAPEATEATGIEEVDQHTEFLALLHHLMPGTKPGKDDRIHLAQIASAWTGDGADTAPVRALLAALNIPTTDCRVPGRGPSKGIYLRDVPPLPDHSREPLSGVVAGPDQQQQQQQRSEVAAQAGFLTKPHPDQPNRTIIEWKNAS